MAFKETKFVDTFFFFLSTHVQLLVRHVHGYFLLLLFKAGGREIKERKQEKERQRENNLEDVELVILTVVKKNVIVAN